MPPIAKHASSEYKWEEMRGCWHQANLEDFSGPQKGSPAFKFDLFYSIQP